MKTLLIVARTKMSNGVCVGGIDEETCESIRLHNEKGGNLPVDAPYEVGDRWTMLIVEKAWNCREEPHVEDKQTKPHAKVENVGAQGIVDFINSHDFGKQLTRGSLDETFEGCLAFEERKGFITRSKIPSFSTQFWVTDKELKLVKGYEGKPCYVYNNVKISFVGFQKPMEAIPEGTLVRLSLANWWKKGGVEEERCYLQLSGWYR